MASMCEDDDSHVQVEPNVVKINSVSLLASVFLLSLLPNHDQQNNRKLCREFKDFASSTPRAG